MTDEELTIVLEADRAQLQAAIAPHEIRQPWGMLIERCESMAAELQRLRSAVPKTADGVAIVLDMEVWHSLAVRGGSSRRRTVKSYFTGQDHAVWIGTVEGYMNFKPEELYSTEAAALAAKEKQ